jgi:hypothetical protein
MATRVVCFSGTDSNSGLRADEVGPLLEIKAHPLIQASDSGVLTKPFGLRRFAGRKKPL